MTMKNDIFKPTYDGFKGSFALAISITNAVAGALQDFIQDGKQADEKKKETAGMVTAPRRQSPPRSKRGR